MPSWVMAAGWFQHIKKFLLEWGLHIGRGSAGVHAIYKGMHAGYREMGWQTTKVVELRG